MIKINHRRACMTINREQKLRGSKIKPHYTPTAEVTSQERINKKKLKLNVKYLSRNNNKVCHGRIIRQKMKLRQKHSAQEVPLF